MQECVNGFSTETQANIFIQSGKSQSSHVRPFYCLSLPLCLHFFLKYFHLFLPPPLLLLFPAFGRENNSLPLTGRSLYSTSARTVALHKGESGLRGEREREETVSNTWRFYVVVPRVGATHLDALPR